MPRSLRTAYEHRKRNTMTKRMNVRHASSYSPSLNHTADISA